MSNHDHTPMTDRSGAADSRTLTIIVGRLDPLLSRRLGRSLGIAPHIRVAVQDLDEAALEDAIAHEQPHVAIITGVCPVLHLSKLASWSGVVISLWKSETFDLLVMVVRRSSQSEIFIT